MTGESIGGARGEIGTAEQEIGAKGEGTIRMMTEAAQAGMVGFIKPSINLFIQLSYLFL
jgi:hypothetical protein